VNDAAIDALDCCTIKQIHIPGWEGGIHTADERVAHGNAPQGAPSLEGLSVPDAAECCRRTVCAGAVVWPNRIQKRRIDNISDHRSSG
jgi:hypothetical protein